MRFSYSSGNQSRQVNVHVKPRGPPRPVAEQTDNPGIQFMQVQVKPVERNLNQLRASKELSTRSQRSALNSQGSMARSDASGGGGGLEVGVSMISSTFKLTC